VRRWLLAFLFCSLAWTAPAQMGAPAVGSDAATIRAATADVPCESGAAVPQDPGGRSSQWIAADRASASVTESVWKSSLVHAALAAARSTDLFVRTAPPDRRDRPSSHRSPHLRHAPLLI